MGGGPILENSDPPALAPPSAPSFGSGLGEKKLGLPAADADEELKKLEGPVLDWAFPEGCEDDDGFCSLGLKSDG